MKAILVGYKRVNIERGSDSVKGTSLFLNIPLKAEESAGFEIDKAWVQSDSKVISIPSNIDEYLGASVDVQYNRRGKIESIEW